MRSRGTPLLNYNAAVQLDTQSGFGTWGARDGLRHVQRRARPTTALRPIPGRSGQSQATFTLSYPQGPPSIDVDVFQISNTGVRDDDAEGALVFSPSGFTRDGCGARRIRRAPSRRSRRIRRPARFPLHARGVRPNAERSRLRHHRRLRRRQESEVLVAVRGSRHGHASTSRSTARSPRRKPRPATHAVTFDEGQAVVTAKYKDVGRDPHRHEGRHDRERGVAGRHHGCDGQLRRAARSPSC